MGSASISTIMTTSSAAFMVSHKGDDQQFWLQLNHGLFGLGGLIGPLIVRIFVFNGFLIIGLLGFVMVPFYARYESA